MYPVCATCRRIMKVEKNGVPFIERDGYGKEYRIWSSDQYKCPMCGYTVLAGFGTPTERFQPGFQARLHRIKRRREGVDYIEEQSPEEKEIMRTPIIFRAVEPDEQEE